MFLKRIPVGIQLILILILVMTIPVTITMYYSTANLIKYSEKEVAESIVAQLKVSSHLNEKELFNIVESTLMLVQNSDFKTMKEITSFEVLNQHYEHIKKVLKFQSYLKTIQDNNEMIESVVFIPESWDYVISSNQSVSKKQDYENLSWLNTALGEMKSLSGYWYPRMKQNTPVISYIYRLNRLTTSIKGVIVVNIYEEKIAELLIHDKYKVDSEAVMLLKDGTILSYKDKSLLFQNKVLPDYMYNMIHADEAFGYYYAQKEGENYICAYYAPGNRQWLYGVAYPMEDMLQGVHTILRKQVVLLLMIMLIGIIGTIFYGKRFSRPMEQLADAIKEKGPLGKGEREGNEIAFLTHAFRQIEEEEEKLYLMLKEKDKDTKKQVIHNLLIGETDENKEQIKELFPYKLFIVGIICIDEYEKYLRKLDTRTRSYQRYLLINAINKHFPHEYVVQAARYDGGDLAVIINMEGYDYDKSPRQIENSFKEISKKAFDIFKHTVSIGISGVHTGEESVAVCVSEAMAVCRKKVFEGYNSIFLWEKWGNREDREGGDYFLYENIEKIINYLGVCNLEGIKKELDQLECNILKRKYFMDYDQVMMIFNQLIGSTIKFMGKRQIHMGSLWGSNQNIYKKLLVVETITEMKALLYEWYKKIVGYMEELNEEVDDEKCYDKRILSYLQEHYTEEVMYEEVAQKMGISYSYLRKIVKRTTGNSVNDYINKMRIEAAKSLLMTTDKNLEEIAGTVGYHNAQSIVRYFKKFEGVTPKEFRETQKHK